MKYQFTKDVNHDGVKRKGGDVLEDKEFPDGSLEPCIRTGIVVPYIEPEPEKEPTTQTTEAAPAERKRK